MTVIADEKLANTLEKKGYISFAYFTKASRMFADGAGEKDFKPYYRFPSIQLFLEGTARDENRDNVALNLCFINNKYEDTFEISPTYTYLDAAYINENIWNKASQSLEKIAHEMKLEKLVALKPMDMKENERFLNIILPIEDNKIALRDEETLESFLIGISKEFYGTSLSKTFSIRSCEQQYIAERAYKKQEGKQISKRIDLEALGHSYFNASALSEHIRDIDKLESLIKHFPENQYFKNYKKEREDSYNKFMNFNHAPT